MSFSGKIYNSVLYGITADGLIDYEDVRQKALENKPKMIVAGFSAYSQVVDWKKMREIADEVGAYLFVDMAHVAGLIAAGLYPNPLPYAHVVTTTTPVSYTHLRIFSRQPQTLINYLIHLLPAFCGLFCF